MRRIGFGVMAIMAICAFVTVSRYSRPVYAQTESGRGWVEGVIVTDRGNPALGADSNGWGGTQITIRPKAGADVQTQSANDKGGFYSLRNIKPGVYEVLVAKAIGSVAGKTVTYRPQHMFGVVVEADKRTVLDLTVHEGDSLEEIGKPAVASQKVIVISEAIAHLQAQIDQLKKQ